jgi:hypothetical protein
MRTKFELLRSRYNFNASKQISKRNVSNGRREMTFERKA